MSLIKECCFNDVFSNNKVFKQNILKHFFNDDFLWKMTPSKVEDSSTGPAYYINDANNGAYLDFLWNDCIQIYPRPGQPEDPEKVAINMRIGSKYKQFLADQCGSDNPFYDSDAVAILDVYNQFFVSLETLKEAYQDLAGTIEMECVNEEGITQTKTIPIMDEEHKWAGDF